jgi:hypothetical protein
MPSCRFSVFRYPCMAPERNTSIPRTEAMDSKAARVPTSPVASSALRSFLFPQRVSPECMAMNTGVGEVLKRELLVNTARTGGGTAILAEVPSIPRRIVITSWASEQDVNLLSLDRVSFESVPLIHGRDGTRRWEMSPQLVLEARRKHASCTIPILPSWRMDCRYVRIDSDEGYVRASLGAHGAEPTRSLGGCQCDRHLSGPATLTVTLAPIWTEDRKPGAGIFPKGLLQPSRRTVCSGKKVCVVPVKPPCWTGRSWPIL